MSDFSGTSQTKLDISTHNNAFYPTLNVGELQELYRVSDDHRGYAMAHHLVMATSHINNELIKFKTAAKLAGINSLNGVAQCFDDEAESLYKTAVYCTAKSTLLRAYQSMNRRKEAAHAGRDGDETTEYYQEQARFAVKRLNNTPMGELEQAASTLSIGAYSL